MVLGVSGSPVAAHAAPPAMREVQSRQPAAVLTVISGNVLMRFGAGDFSAATDGAVLYVGSTVRTSAGARAVLTLFEGSTVELEPASDIAIEDATTRGASTIVQLAQSLGRSWHVVTHLTTADSRYEVRTPAATASVRGTSFEVAVDDGTTTVTTTEGRVATADAAGSNEVLVSADQTTTVRGNAAPEAPRSAPDAVRVVTVSAVSASSLVIDPLGRANGIKDGKVLVQTPGARVRMVAGTIVVTLPNVPEGVFTTTVASTAGDPVVVTTTVTDEGGGPPVSVTNAAPADGAGTSGVELRRTENSSEVRALTADEIKRWSDVRADPKKASLRSSPKATNSAASPTRAAPADRVSQPNKENSTTQPAVSPRRAASPSPSPTKR
jgi:hypothetical protein